MLTTTSLSSLATSPFLFFNFSKFRRFLSFLFFFLKSRLVSYMFAVLVCLVRAFSFSFSFFRVLFSLPFFFCISMSNSMSY